jgi:predicted SnoaL-like aldol condensation-catalyzing enzyme
MIRRAFLSRAGLVSATCAGATLAGATCATGLAVADSSPARADTAGGGQPERNARVVQDALRVVFSEHRVDEVNTYFAPDFVQYSPYAPAGGRDVLKAWWAGFVYSVPDVTTTVIRPPVAQGQDVATFRIVTGTVMHDLPALGITADGQHLEFRAADIFQVVRGQIVAHWETVDTGPILQLASR